MRIIYLVLKKEIYEIVQAESETQPQKQRHGPVPAVCLVLYVWTCFLKYAVGILIWPSGGIIVVKHSSDFPIIISIHKVFILKD
jgi:hypothetical protein